MKKSRFTEVQIVKILSEQNQGKTVNEICREHGISQPTFYNWKSKYEIQVNGIASRLLSGQD